MELESIKTYCHKLMKNHGSSDSSIPIRWNDELQQAGYYSCNLSVIDSTTRWQQAHAWCGLNIGEQHYVWTGSKFWFDRSDNLVMFSLKWG